MASLSLKVVQHTRQLLPLHDACSHLPYNVQRHQFVTI